MSANTQINQRHFESASAVALLQPKGQMDHDGDLDNPFFGANLWGYGRVVVWRLSDPRTDAIPDGTVEMLNEVFAYKKL